MAVLKAPLLSLGAKQKLGDALVFFPWKGLDVVRSYVIPANPRSADQTTQRDFFTAAVDAIHAAQALVSRPLAAIDQIALALYASCEATPRTWFNQIVKTCVDLWVDGKKNCILCGAIVTEAAAQVTVTIRDFTENMANCEMWYGKTKTALNTKVNATLAAGIWTGVAAGLTPDTKYYFQFRAKAGDPCQGFRSGIYHGTPT